MSTIVSTDVNLIGEIMSPEKKKTKPQPRKQGRFVF